MKAFKQVKNKGDRPGPNDIIGTPPEFFAGLNERFKFQLDAACLSSNCLCRNGLCQDEGRDGLLEPWIPGPVWLNPPYSNTGTWLRKAATEGRRVTVACLVPADTSTKWWWEAVQYADEVWFVHGRLRFRDEGGEAIVTKRGGGAYPGPSAVIVFRPGSVETTYGYLSRGGNKIYTTREWEEL